MTAYQKRSVIKTDLFADQHHNQTLNKPGDPLTEIEVCIDFAALVAEVDRIDPRQVSLQGGSPPFPTERKAWTPTGPRSMARATMTTSSR